MIARRLMLPPLLVGLLLMAGCSDDDAPAGSPTPAPTATESDTATPAPTNTAPDTATPVATPTDTATPEPGSGQVSGLIVLAGDVRSSGDDALAAPPADWSEEADQESFDRAMGFAEWRLTGPVERHGSTTADGRFALSSLPPGAYQLHVVKTLAGDLFEFVVPVVVGDDGEATVVVTVSRGRVHTVLTYVDGGVEVREVHSTRGTRAVRRNGQLVEIGGPGNTYLDPDGDGLFQPTVCPDQVWSCEADGQCGDDRVCACTASCPLCEDCGPPTCVPPGVQPYRCGDDGGCVQPGDRCVCVSSCPECDDCTMEVCVPSCDPVEIVALEVVGPERLVVGRSGQLQAIADLSNGQPLDVTELVEWSVSPADQARIDRWGSITALATGPLEVSATFSDVTSDAWSIEVVERPGIRAISIRNFDCFPYYERPVPGDPVVGVPEAPPLDEGLLPPHCTNVVRIGSTVTLGAYAEYDDGSVEDITQQVTWTVTPAEVGDMNRNVFTARTVGNADVRATFDEVTSAPFSIRVVDQPTVISLHIYADHGHFLPEPFFPGGPFVDGTCPDCGYQLTVLLGETLRFHANAQYDTGEWADVTSEVSWRSSDSAVATISAAGELTALAAGEVAVDATLNEVTSAPIDVNVVEEATLLSLDIYLEGRDRVIGKGDQAFFRANGFFDIGIGRDLTEDATWQSSDPSVARFDSPGVLTGVSAGNVEVTATYDGVTSNPLPFEVFESSELEYCDPAHVNRGVWTDGFNRVLLESDCGHYTAPDVATIRFTVTERERPGGIFDPCLDLFVYQGDRKVRTIREEGCGEPFLAPGAPEADEQALRYQTRAFWDLKNDQGSTVVPGTYTIYGRFFLYYDPVVSIDVTILESGAPTPTPGDPTPTPTPTPRAMCTPPRCNPGETLVCPDAGCQSECDLVCVPNPDEPVELEIGPVAAAPGQIIELPVVLRAPMSEVAGLQNDLMVDPPARFALTAEGDPACRINPEIDKPASVFRFTEDGQRVRAVILAIDNVDPIPDGALLYTCDIELPAEPDPPVYLVHCDGALASDPTGREILATCPPGEIIVAP